MKKTNLPLVIALFFTVFFEIFNFTVTIMASPYIVGDLGGSNEIAPYTTTFFSFGNALCIPIGNFLAERVGRVRLLLICLSLLLLFTCACAVAPTYPVFIAFRFLKGFFTGPIYLLVITRLFSLAASEKKSVYSSILVTIFAVAPVIGACWGGFIAYDFTWRWIFYIHIPILLFLIFFFARTLKNQETPRQKIPFNAIGYFSFLIGLFSICFVLTTGQEFDWYRCWPLVFLFVLGVFSSIFYLLWDLHHPHPILHLRLLKNGPFAFALFFFAFIFSAYFGMIILLPLWLSLFVNYTPIWIAVLIGTMAVSGVLPSLLVLDKFGKLDFRIPLGAALLFFAVSCFHTMLFNEYVDFERIAFSRILAGFGLTLFLPPIFRTCFESFSEEKTPEVLSLFQTVRATACGLGAGIYAIIWQRRAIFFHSRLDSQLTPFSPETQEYYAQAEKFNLVGDKANAELEELLIRQATSLGLDDTFYLMGWIFMGLFAILCFTVFLRRKSVTEEHLISERTE